MSRVTSMLKFYKQAWGQLTSEQQVRDVDKKVLGISSLKNDLGAVDAIEALCRVHGCSRILWCSGGK